MKRVFVHLLLWLTVVLYTFLGAWIFQELERHSVVPSSSLSAAWLTEMGLELGELSPEAAKLEVAYAKRMLESWDAALAAGRSFSQVMQEEKNARAAERAPDWHWDLPSSILYAFTVITTIGYGHVTPSSTGGRLMTMLYALVGIPLTMLAVADLGKFVAEGLLTAVDMAKKRLPSGFRRLVPSGAEPAEETDRKGLAASLVLVAAFASLVLLSAALLPFWENLAFHDALYFSFVTATTIGFGDIVPRSAAFLFPTLMLMTLCLALTTVFIEQAAGTFKRIHYFGVRLRNVGDVVVWFGGQRITVGRLVRSVGRRWGVADALLEKMDLDELVIRVAAGEEIGPSRPPTPPPSAVRPQVIRSLDGIKEDEILFMDDSESVTTESRPL